MKSVDLGVTLPISWRHCGSSHFLDETELGHAKVQKGLHQHEQSNVKVCEIIGKIDQSPTLKKDYFWL